MVYLRRDMYVSERDLGQIRGVYEIERKIHSGNGVFFGSLLQ